MRSRVFFKDNTPPTSYPEGVVVIIMVVSTVVVF
ncbi:MAG: hypothetical protein ACI8U1_001696, partial [Rheinheimera aquimaris]